MNIISQLETRPAALQELTVIYFFCCFLPQYACKCKHGVNLQWTSWLPRLVVCVCLWACTLLSLRQLINYRGPWKGGIRPAPAMASINTHLNDTLEVNSYFCPQPRMHTHEGWQLNMLNEHAMSSVTSGHSVRLVSREECTQAVLC